MNKLYEITLNEYVAKSVMVYLSERCGHDTLLVNKIAAQVPAVPRDYVSVSFKVTADEMVEVLNAIITLGNLT